MFALQLIADAYAKNGFKTFMPDLFNGDPAPLNLGEPGVSKYVIDPYASNSEAEYYPWMLM